ncbi:MAG TPA: TPM domain-containing protein [Chthoniobacterales bacterium]|nr:TPM domain-containing protein [Chthoniobacterales bacterium]
MKCPSCAAVLEKPEARCPQCKLALQKLDMKFGLVPAHSRFLSDRTGRLPIDEMNQLRAELRLFQKRFPQSLFSIFVTELPAGTSVAEYAFWLANRAKFGPIEKKHGENFNILMVVDMNARAAAITVGYGLEPHMSEEQLRNVLEEFAAAARDGDLAKGLRAATEALTRTLRDISARTRQVELAETEA